MKRTLVLLIVKLDNLAGVLHWCNWENVMAKQWYLVHYTLTLICIVLFFSVITAQITITTRATLYSGVHGQEFIKGPIFVVEFLPRVPESPTRKFLLVESGILGSGIRKPTNDSGIRNPCSTDKESRTQCLESGILDVESKIQDCFSLWNLAILLRCRRIFPPCQKLKNTVKRSI